MTKTGELIGQIADVRARRRFGHAMAELPFRLHEIERSFRGLDQNHGELIRYFPVALVATIEGYFRMVIAELIDHGDPYLKRAESANTREKFDFTVLRAVHGKKLSVGELYAHGLPFSSLAHIHSHMTALLERPFADAVSKIHDRWEVEVLGQPPNPILEDAGAVFKAVTRTFELRHIICHEIASAHEFDAAEIGDCIEKCVLFLRATDEFIGELRQPGYPLTQGAMNEAAGKTLELAREGLREAIAGRRSQLGTGSAAEKLFDEAQATWEKFAEQWCDFAVGPRSESGSIWPVVYFGAMEELVNRRADELRSFKPFDES